MSGSFGVSLKITVSTTLTAIAQMLDVQFPKQTKETVDNTAHDTTGGYRTKVSTGLRLLEPFTCTLEWDVDETTHATVLTAFDSDDTVAMSIEDPAGDEVISFDAHIKSVGRIAALADVFKAEVEIEPSGAPSIA